MFFLLSTLLYCQLCLGRDIINLVHQLSVIIVNGMTKYYPKEFISAALVEGVKFCVPLQHVYTVLKLFCLLHGATSGIRNLS